MGPLVARLGGFVGTTLTSLVAGVLSVSCITLGAGPTAWAELTVGQTVGALVAVLTAGGWGVNGAVLTAGTPTEERPRLYAESLLVRAALLIPSIALVAVIVPLVVRSHLPEALIAAIAVLTTALSASWFFVGEGAPVRLLLFDTLPRSLLLLGGSVCVLLGAPLLVAAIAILAGAVAAATVSAARILRGKGVGIRGLWPGRSGLRAQLPHLSTAATSSVYVNLPLILVAHFAPAQTAPYALGDRLLRYGIIAVAPLTQVAQSWVPRSVARELASRARRATLAALLAGAVAAVTFAVLARPVSEVISGGAIRPEPWLAVAFGTAFGAIVASQVVGLAVLLALDRPRGLFVSTLAGALFGVPAVAVGASVGGAVGACAAFATSEILVLGTQLGLVLRQLSHHRFATEPLTSEVTSGDPPHPPVPSV